MFRYFPLLLGVKLISASQSASQQQAVNDLIIEDKYKTLRKSYKNPKYPIVLCHGLSGFDRLIVIPPLIRLTPNKDDAHEFQDTFVANSTAPGGLYFDYWYGIKDALEQNGCTVLVAKVPPFGSIEDRSVILNQFIEQKVKGLKESTDNDPDQIYNDDNKANENASKKIKVNLIAHSMGGLDSRYLIAKLKQANFEVMSLTTIATPHHGSAFADYVVNTANKLATGGGELIPKSIHELTMTHLQDFNKDIQNDSKVKYFSYGGQFTPNLTNMFYYSWKIIQEQEGANDGLVSVKSAHWGKYLGTLDNVDHLDSINWSNQMRNFWYQYVRKKPVNFNAIALYLDIIDQLATEGL